MVELLDKYYKKYEGLNQEELRNTDYEYYSQLKTGGFLKYIPKQDKNILRAISPRSKHVAESLYIQCFPISEIEKKSELKRSQIEDIVRPLIRINPKTKRPFQSLIELRQYQKELILNRPDDENLSDIIKRRLSELGQNRFWLAKVSGLSNVSVYNYINKISVPKQNVVQKIYSALGIEDKEESLERRVN